MQRTAVAVATAVAMVGGFGIGAAIWIQLRHGARPPAPTIEIDLPR